MTSASQRARERAEARRLEIAARQRKEARRRLVLRVGLPVLLVVLVVVALVVVKVSGGFGGDKPAAQGVIASGTAPADVVGPVTSLTAADFNQVGAGDVSVTPTPLTGQPALTADGKPRVLYVGAEFCPYCAAERWVVVAALSRFGQFSGLGQTNSSASDVYANTATLSFHGATYTSQYLSFTGYETTTNKLQGSNYATLDTLSSADQAIVAKYNATPYVSQQSAGSIPFQDLGNRYLVSGTSYSPELLGGKTHAQIAAAIADPSTAIGKAVLASANVYTAALCKLTDGQPGDVCSSPGVTAAAGKLAS